MGSSSRKETAIDLQKLAAELRGLWNGPGDQRDDAVQEAVAEAIQVAGASHKRLRAIAIQSLNRVEKKWRLDARRGGAVRDADEIHAREKRNARNGDWHNADHDGNVQRSELLPSRRRRSPGERYVPKGTMRVAIDKSPPEYVCKDVGDEAFAESLFMEVTTDETLAFVGAEASTNAIAAAILSEELQRARLEQLSSEAAASYRAPPDSRAPTDGVVAVLKPNAEAKRRWPNLRKVNRLEVILRRKLLRRHGIHSLFALVGDVMGTEMVVAHEITEDVAHFKPSRTCEPGELAKIALARARVRLVALGRQFPPHLDDESLVRLLLHRTSFEGGGGPNGALSAQRMRDLLSNPVELAAFVETETPLVALSRS